VKPRTLRMKNYRKFEDAILEFSEGITGIIGFNGAGKSTIVEAMEWALYGSSGSAGRGDRKENIKRVGAGDRDDCLVEFEFSLGKEEYTVRRWLKGKNNTAGAELLHSSGTTLAVGTREVTSKIEELLGFDFKSFEVSVFAKQSELAALSSTRPHERRELILRLLGIKRIDDAVDRISADRREQIKEYERLESALKDKETDERLVDVEKARLASQKEEVSRTKEELKSLLSRKKELERNLAGVLERMEALEEKRIRYGNLKSELARIEEKMRNDETNMKRTLSEIEELEEKERLLPALEEARKREESLRMELEGMKEQYDLYRQLDEMKRKKASLEDTLARLEKEIARLEKGAGALESLEAELAEAVRKREEAEMEVERLQASKSELEGQRRQAAVEAEKLTGEMSKLEELGEESECPTCHRPLKGHYRVLITDFEGQIQSLEKLSAGLDSRIAEVTRRLSSEKERLKALGRRVSSLEASIESAKRDASVLAERNGEREAIASEIEELTARMAKIGSVSYDERRFRELQEEHGKLEDSVRKYWAIKQEADRLPSLRERAKELEAGMEESVARKAELEAEMKQLGYSEEERLVLEKERSAINRELQDAGRSIATAEERIRNGELRMAEIEKTIRSLEERERELEELREGMEYMAKAEELIRRFRTDLIQRIRPTLSQGSSALLQRITEGKYTLVDFDEDYNIRVMDEGVLYPIDRFSGGEKDLINLCVRLAISQAVLYFRGKGGDEDSRINTIILDEVFSSQDEDRKRNILNTLNALKKSFSHIIVISHLPDVKESVNHLIRVEEDPETRTSFLRIEG